MVDVKRSFCKTILDLFALCRYQAFRVALLASSVLSEIWYYNVCDTSKLELGLLLMSRVALHIYALYFLRLLNATVSREDLQEDTALP